MQVYAISFLSLRLAPSAGFPLWWRENPALPPAPACGDGHRAGAGGTYGVFARMTIAENLLMGAYSRSAGKRNRSRP